jgi:two-component system response regulator VicR
MSQKILLIEDDEDLSNLYRIGLEKSSFEVTACRNGLEAISVAMTQDCDLILLDLMMPLADGRDVMAMLGLNQKTKNIPIIIISNLDKNTLDLSHLDDQVIDYWVKADLTPKSLSAKLKSYFSS